MHKHLQVSFIIGILAFSSGQDLSAKTEASPSADKKKVALALPRESKDEQSTVSRPILVTPTTPMAVPVPSKVVGATVNPASSPTSPQSFGADTAQTSDSSVSLSSGSRQTSTNISGPADFVSTIQEVASKGFERAERLTSVYDKRISQMIAWLANSLMPSTTITPINSPSLCSKQRHLRIADGQTKEQRRRAYLFN
ncbi:MAG: hypothetical protein K2X77_05995 [Candidatus Obscuribacterales bacterium]|jgi:hypothetical protein|nr:hypothetical protein [Candidatus Obscuribacterales bacterium]